MICSVCTLISQLLNTCAPKTYFASKYFRSALLLAQIINHNALHLTFQDSYTCHIGCYSPIKISWHADGHAIEQIHKA